MFPIINIGPLAIQAPGFILLLAFAIGLWMTGIFAKNLGTNRGSIENSIFIGLFSGFAAARIGFFLQNPSVFQKIPLLILSLTPSMFNLSFGLLVGTLTVVIYAQKKHLPLWPTLDTYTPMIILTFAGLHLANFAKGDRFGVPTNLPWSIQLWNINRHPVQLYGFLLSTIVFTSLLIHTGLFKRTGFQKSGMLISLTLGSVGFINVITRAFIAQKSLLMHWDTWQIVGFALMIICFVTLYHKGYRKGKHIPVLVSMGSNYQPKENLSGGFARIKSQFKVRRASNLYITEDVKGKKDSPHFINQVIEIDVNQSFKDLITSFKSIEMSFSRVPGNNKVVPLDLDVLTYNNDVFFLDGKTIPDPNLIKYKYIALPLAEIDPDFRHPASGKSIEEIIEQLNDQTKIHQIQEVENGFKS